MHKKRHSSSLAFTLIELLVVIAIIAILAVVVVLVLNPAELLKQSRDSSRLSDAATLKSAIGLYSEDVGGSMGSSSTVYISIPDPTATTTAGDQCQGLGLLPLSSSTYHCPASSTYRNVNSLGWIPINFTSSSVGSPIGSLPLDPLDTSSTGYFYTYNTNSTQYEVTMAFESSKNLVTEASDGGPYADLYEVGTNLALAPVDFYGLINNPIVAYVASGTTWSAVTNGAPITIEAIGGGAGGSQDGGGGGEYCKSVVAYTSGASIPISIGQGGTSSNGGNGGNTTWNTSVVVAVGGKTGGTNGGVGGTGGTGTTCYNGGNTFFSGWPGGVGGGNGGGGAGGPHGTGGNGGTDGNNNGSGGGGNGGGFPGVSDTGSGNGGNNYNNAGGGSFGSPPTVGMNGGGGGGGNFGIAGAAGGNGTDWSTSPVYGSGGGGGGGGQCANGAAGGLYGGGGGGGGWSSGCDVGGNGGGGILVITYFP